jgi:hypothetical protein
MILRLEMINNVFNLVVAVRICLEIRAVVWTLNPGQMRTCRPHTRPKMWKIWNKIFRVPGVGMILPVLRNIIL